MTGLFAQDMSNKLKAKGSNLKTKGKKLKAEGVKLRAWYLIYARNIKHLYIIKIT